MELTHVNLTNFELSWTAILMLVNQAQMQWVAVKPDPESPQPARQSTQDPWSLFGGIRLVRVQDPPTLVALHFRKLLNEQKRPRVRYHVGGVPMLQQHSSRSIRRERFVYDAVRDACITENAARKLRRIADEVVEEEGAAENAVEDPAAAAFGAMPPECEQM